MPLIASLQPAVAAFASWPGCAVLLLLLLNNAMWLRNVRKLKEAHPDEEIAARWFVIGGSVRTHPSKGDSDNLSMDESGTKGRRTFWLGPDIGRASGTPRPLWLKLTMKRPH
jgi:hypothetical protein